jgi:hypothetical protein
MKPKKPMENIAKIIPGAPKISFCEYFSITVLITPKAGIIKI